MNEKILSDCAINVSPAIHKAWVDLNGDLDNCFDPMPFPQHLVIAIKEQEGIKVGTYSLCNFGHEKGNEHWAVVCTVSEFKEYCETMRKINQCELIAPIEPNGFPPVGYTLKFTHDYFGDFKYLHSEKYGWENGDNLEIIHATENQHGEPVVIVLNTQGDVLTTAVIDDPLFFDTRTEREKEIHSVMIGLGHESNELHANNVVYATIQQMLEMGYSK